MTQTLLTDPCDDWLPAAPFRAHLQHLVEGSGLDWRVVSAAAGLPSRTTRPLVTDGPRCRRRMRHCDAARLYAVTDEWLAAQTRLREPSHRARRLLRRLGRMGVSDEAVSRCSGVAVGTLRQLRAGELPEVTVLQRLRLQALTDQVTTERDAHLTRLGHMSETEVHTPLAAA